MKTCRVIIIYLICATKGYGQNSDEASGVICGVSPENSMDVCKDYAILNETWRHIGSPGGDNCDDSMTTGWYRFYVNGVSAQIPTVCIKNSACGTTIPLRVDLNRRVMPEEGCTMEAVSCGSYVILGKWDCCVLRQNILIHNCGGFYVYKLSPPDRCHMGYCSQVTNDDIEHLTRKTGESAEVVTPITSFEQEDDDISNEVTENVVITEDNSLLNLSTPEPEPELSVTPVCSSACHLSTSTPVCSRACLNGTCIPESYWCDGIPDCDDNADEDSCGPSLPHPCPEGLKRCDDGSCVRPEEPCITQTENEVQSSTSPTYTYTFPIFTRGTTLLAPSANSGRESVGTTTTTTAKMSTQTPGVENILPSKQSFWLDSTSFQLNGGHPSHSLSVENILPSPPSMDPSITPEGQILSDTVSDTVVSQQTVSSDITSETLFHETASPTAHSQSEIRQQESYSHSIYSSYEDLLPTVSENSFDQRHSESMKPSQSQTSDVHIHETTSVRINTPDMISDSQEVIVTPTLSFKESYSSVISDNFRSESLLSTSQISSDTSLGPSAPVTMGISEMANRVTPSSRLMNTITWKTHTFTETLSETDLSVGDESIHISLSTEHVHIIPTVVIKLSDSSAISLEGAYDQSPSQEEVTIATSESSSVPIFSSESTATSNEIHVLTPSHTSDFKMEMFTTESPTQVDGGTTTIRSDTPPVSMLLPQTTSNSIEPMTKKTQQYPYKVLIIFKLGERFKNVLDSFRLKLQLALVKMMNHFYRPVRLSRNTDVPARFVLEDVHILDAAVTGNNLTMATVAIDRAGNASDEMIPGDVLIKLLERDDVRKFIINELMDPDAILIEATLDSGETTTGTITIATALIPKIKDEDSWDIHTVFLANIGLFVSIIIIISVCIICIVFALLYMRSKGKRGSWTCKTKEYYIKCEKTLLMQKNRRSIGQIDSPLTDAEIMDDEEQMVEKMPLSSEENQTMDATTQSSVSGTDTIDNGFDEKGWIIPVNELLENGHRSMLRQEDTKL